MTTTEVQIRLAVSDDDYKQVFRLRHDVLVADHYLAPRGDGMLRDRFDRPELSRILVAQVDARIVGTLRWTLSGPGGTPAEEYADFSASIEFGAACGSQFAVVREHRANHSVSEPLLQFFHRLCAESCCPQSFGAMNPRISSFMNRFGYQEVGPVQVDSRTNLPFVPMVRDFRSERNLAARLAYA